jgi:hypothetical protein
MLLKYLYIRKAGDEPCIGLHVEVLNMAEPSDNDGIFNFDVCHVCVNQNDTNISMD